MPSSNQGIPLPTADAVLSPTRANSLMGVDACANGGAVKFFLRENSATGKIVGCYTLVDGESLNDWYGPDGKRVDGQLFIDVVTGGAFIQGTAWVN